jgi:hypothetical protein
MGRRIPKQTVTGFKFQNETSNVLPFLSIRIRGKEEIIPFKANKEMFPIKEHLCSIFSEFVKIGDWYFAYGFRKTLKKFIPEAKLNGFLTFSSLFRKATLASPSFSFPYSY